MTALLEKMIPVDNEHTTITASKPALPEMLTIKECAALVSGLTEHTVRMLVKQGKVKYIRCGEGARGKILVSKDSLLKYLGAVCAKKSCYARPKGVQRNAAAKAFVAPFRSDKSIFALIVSDPSCGNTIPPRKEK